MPINLSQIAVPVESDLETAVGLFIRLVGENKGIFFESAEVDGRWGRFSIIATDFLLTLSCKEGELVVKYADERLAPMARHSGKPFIDGLRDLMKDIDIEEADSAKLPPITRAFYGYLGYGISGLLEPKLAPCLPLAEAEAELALPGTLIFFDHGYNKLTRISFQIDGKAVTPLSGVCHSSSTPAKATRPSALSGKEAYTRSVSKVRELIRQGEAIQVVLSTPFKAPLSESPFSLYRRLRRANPSPYMFYLRLEETTIVGSSPEVLVSCEKNKLRLCPIAGTRPRSSNTAEDVFFSDELLKDPKERAEHVMLVDLGRNDLGRIARQGSVSLDRFMEVERFSHVMHLTSRISADLEEGLDAIDIIRSAFPAGTVSGAPKVRAMEIIAEEEQSPRGPYAGAVGWLGLDKDAVNLDFGIIIRTLWIRDGQINWQAGAGIVYDSDPETEWKECCNKAAVIRKVVFGDENIQDNRKSGRE